MQSKEKLSSFPLGTQMSNYNFNLSLVTFAFTYNSFWMTFINFSEYRM